MDRTPEQLLEETLIELGVRKTDLGRHFKAKQPYQLVQKWIKGQGFNERNQRAAEDFLGLPRGYFERPEQASHHRREAHRVRVLEEFLATDLGKEATESEVRVLRSIRFLDDILPTTATYAAILLALSHRLASEKVAEVLQYNEELRLSAKKKREPR